MDPRAATPTPAAPTLRNSRRLSFCVFFLSIQNLLVKSLLASPSSLLPVRPQDSTTSFPDLPNTVLRHTITVEMA
jgi:hypothetical protein